MHQNIRSRYRGINVPRGERIASVVAGGVLAAVAVRSRSLLLGALGGALVGRGATGHCPVYRLRATRRGISVHRAITIQASPMEVYQLWRDFTNLPKFMEHVSEVEVDSGGISTWRIREHNLTLGWRAEITEDTPGVACAGARCPAATSRTRVRSTCTRRRAAAARSSRSARVSPPRGVRACVLLPARPARRGSRAAAPAARDRRDRDRRVASRGADRARPTRRAR